MKIVKTVDKATVFTSAFDALHALKEIAQNIPDDFGDVIEWTVKPFNGGWRASIRNRYSFVRFVSEY